MTEEFLDEGDSLDLTDEERAALLDDIEQIDDATDPSTGYAGASCRPFSAPAWAGTFHTWPTVALSRTCR